MEKLLTVEEVAEFLRVKPSTVYELVHKGKLRGIRLSRTALRIRESELDEFINKRTAKEPVPTMETEKPKEKPVIRERPPVLSTVEIAQKLGVSKQMVLKWILQGQLPATRIGKYYYVYENDFARFLEQNANTVQKEGQKGNGVEAKENDNLVFLSGEKLF